MKKFKEFNTWVVEKDEHKKSSTYKKLTPKMKKAVDDVFITLEKNPSDFLGTFEKNVEKVEEEIEKTEIERRRERRRRESGGDRFSSTQEKIQKEGEFFLAKNKGAAAPL